jgi:hypothetical protein
MVEPKLFVDDVERGADNEFAFRRYAVYERARRAASKALAELLQRQRRERRRYGEEAETNSEG